MFNKLRKQNWKNIEYIFYMLCISPVAMSHSQSNVLRLKLPKSFIITLYSLKCKFRHMGVSYFSTCVLKNFFTAPLEKQIIDWALSN